SFSRYPIEVAVGNVTAAVFPYEIPPHGMFRMRPQPTNSEVTPGSVRIAPVPAGATPSCFAIFSYTRNDIAVSTAGFAALPAARASRMYIESSNVFGQPGSIQSLVTIANSSNKKSVKVGLEVLNLDGTSNGLSTSAEIPAGGQMVRLAKDLFPQLPSRFTGIL